MKEGPQEYRATDINGVVELRVAVDTTQILRLPGGTLKSDL